MKIENVWIIFYIYIYIYVYVQKSIFRINFRIKIIIINVYSPGLHPPTWLDMTESEIDWKMLKCGYQINCADKSCKVLDLKSAYLLWKTGNILLKVECYIFGQPSCRFVISVGRPQCSTTMSLYRSLQICLKNVNLFTLYYSIFSSILCLSKMSF